jgi:hypothetical protein
MFHSSIVSVSPGTMRLLTPDDMVMLVAMFIELMGVNPLECDTPLRKIVLDKLSAAEKIYSTGLTDTAPADAPSANAPSANAKAP